MKKKLTKTCFLQGSMGKSTLLKMKLLTIMMLGLVTVSAANNTYSQSTKFVLNLNDVSVKEVLQKIEENSEFILLYNENDVIVNRRVDISVNNETVESVLKQLFKNTRNVWRIYDRQIVILEDENAEIPAFLKQKVNEAKSSQSQQKVISGIVTDFKGIPLPGVSIIVKGTTKGTITDFDGNYSISVDVTDTVLTFSYIGFKTKDISVVDKSTIDVTLMEEVQGLDEVVVVGYGTQKKSVLTGSISSVDLDGVEDQQVARIEDVLQGRTTGLTITSSSGAPGAPSTIRVRGATSLNSGANNPLYIVDGLVVNNGSIDNLNPDDIKSIEVLKDAASAAIYGARSSAGVILVTTKMGSNINGFRVSYNAYTGVQSPAKRLDVLDASEYATIVNELYVNSGRRPLFNDPSSFGNGTDWQKEIFNNGALTQKHMISINGGNDKSNFYTSFGYYDQEGVIATDISQYKRYNLRINTTHKIKDWIKVGQTASYSRVKNLGGVPENTQFGGPLSAAIMMDPLTPVFETDKAKLENSPYTNPNVVKSKDNRFYGISENVSQQVYNPLAYIRTKEGNFGWSENLIANGFIEINLTPDLIFKTFGGGTVANFGDETFSPTYFLNASVENLNNSFNITRTKNYNWNVENTITYKKQLKKHNFSFLAGQGSYADNITSSLDVTYFNLPVNNHGDATLNYDVGIDNIVASGNEFVVHNVSSLFGRITYDFDEKYLFTGNIRRDGSSRFGANNKYGTFPSASFGWVPTKESFWIENTVVNYLKFRVSYGVTGNDTVGNFQFVSTVSDGSNYYFGSDTILNSGSSPNAPANPDLRWEETTQFNLGFDANFFQNIRMTFDIFDKKTTGILQQIVIPRYSGSIGKPSGNIADMSNKGVEIELSYRNKFGDFYIEMGANASYLKNEVTFLGDGVQFLEGGISLQNSSYPITRTAVGHPIGAFYGFKHDGLFQNQEEVENYRDPETGEKIQPNAEPGDIRWVDLDGDGTIGEKDRTFIGNPNPDWSYGLNIKANWRSFDLLIFGQGVAGNEIFQGLRRLDIPTANWQTNVFDRWYGEGSSNFYPRLTLEDTNKNFTNPSALHLEKGDYFRLKTLQIGYSLPEEFLKPYDIERFRFYVTANNLFTITNYSGYDPEIGGNSLGIDLAVYPQARSFMLGVNFEFK